AVRSPFDVTGGSRSGDGVRNGAFRFGLGGAQGSDDLTTVLLHEAGHSLGLDHSPDPASVMYEDYLGTRSGLSAGDIAAIQAMYGARTPDSNEGSTGNDSFSTATGLVVPFSLSGNVALDTDGDITTLQDKDYFKFNTLLS